APEYLEQFGTPQRPADLKNHNCILLGETRNWNMRDPQGNLHEIRVTGHFTTNLGEAVTDVVSAGGGIGLKSVWDVVNHLETGRLVQVLVGHTIEPTWQVWAVRPPNKVPPTRVQVFTNFLEDKFRRSKLGAEPVRT
ncbi:MAG: LysR substrate-binding domain-containing protein, partial [Sulfitobacter sp.]